MNWPTSKESGRYIFHEHMMKSESNNTYSFNLVLKSLIILSGKDFGQKYGISFSRMSRQLSCHDTLWSKRHHY